jgi:hypothetical protein
MVIVPTVAGDRDGLILEMNADPLTGLSSAAVL